MNDETKEILIDLVNYYNTMGTESDPGIHTFEHVVKRASKALERHAKDQKRNSADVDPFALDTLAHTKPEPIIKSENEW